MHNGQENKDNAEQKNDQLQKNALTTTTVATTSTSLTTRSARRSISPQALATEITTCTQTGRELIALTQDLSTLLTTEIPNIVRLPEILAKRVSSLFPKIDLGNNILANIQAATAQLAAYELKILSSIPARMVSGAQQAINPDVLAEGRGVLEQAIHGAGGPASDALELYRICTGIHSLYNTYTELNRIYNSILFCSQRIYTSAQELTELTGSNEQWNEIIATLFDYWNQPGFDFNAFLTQAKENLQATLEPLSSLIDLYNAMEPIRVSTYLVLTMQPDPNTESQLEQVTGLLTNACYNTVLHNISDASKSAGNTLARSMTSGLPATGMKALKSVGTKAALTACATAITGMSFPITIAVLATCVSDPSQRNALIAYAKSRILGSQVGETKSDENVRALVSNELDALAQDKSSLSSRLKAKIPAKASEAVNTAMERCVDASGKVVGAVAEQAILTLMRDSNFVSTLRDRLDPVIYQILDGTLRQALQIPEQKAFLEKIQHMSNTEAAAYQACGALIPDMVNFLALPNLVETQLQAATSNPYICSATGKPLDVKEKTIQGVTRLLRVGAEINVDAASNAVSSMIKAGQAVRTAVRGSENPLPPPPAALSNAAESPLLALGSTVNRELATGLRIYLVEKGTPEESILAPAIVFSRKTTASLGGLMSSESIEIKSFKLSEKTRGLATALESLVTGRTRTIHMENLEKENAELKNQSEKVVKTHASRTNPISSVLLSRDHPLVLLMTEQLQHESSNFNYLEQNDRQQATLAVQRQRAIDNEALKKQAAELAKTKDAATKCGFGEAFFEDFETNPVIQERYERLQNMINNDVDTLPINLEPNEASKVRQYIKTRLINQKEILLSHINAANERLNAQKLNAKPIKERLAAVEEAIVNVDNLGWFGSTWFVSSVAPEARTHYLALLDLEKCELEATIASLDQPLKHLESGEYDLVTAYVSENPTNAALLLAEVSFHKSTFKFWQSFPASLLELEKLLLKTLEQNKPTENVPSVTMHLPQAPVTPALLFTGVSKPNVPPNVSDKQETKKDVYDYKAEEEAQLAYVLKLSKAEAEAASDSKIGPKTITGWELTDVAEIGNCFYEAIALQLHKNNFPIAETFPETRPENGGTALVDILRRRSTPEFRDRDWAGEEEILALASEFKIVIAIVDTRSEKPAFQYHFVKWDGTADNTNREVLIPKGQIVVELAYTGNHYLSVTSKPGSPASSIKPS